AALPARGCGRVPFSCRAGVCSAVLEVHVGTGSVYSVEGEGAVLPAWYTSSSQKKPYISWILKKAAAEHFQVMGMSGGKRGGLKPRVGFLHPVLTHNISLFINATREHDSGQYICSVNVVDDIISPVRNMAIINLTVLVPPAPPACRLKGSPTVGANVTLSCASQKGKPSPLYKWQRQEPTKQVFFPPAQDRARGTLKLTNLSLDMSGLYECEAENRAGSAKCSIILEVHSTSEGAVIAGAVLGSVGALATVAFFAQRVLGYRRKKRDGQEEAANEIKEDAVAPKTPTWTRTRPADTISKTSTLSSIVGSRDRPYGASPPSDTASVLTAAGSYRGPPRAGAHPPATNGAPWRPPQPVAPPGGLPPSSLARAGAVPVMVPAQSRAGSLV
uniref:Endothelial cell adhesion molecule n=1 Tax=Pavo cristatus TaxID=9049 RepID=A0A8C9G3T5_PAVCR